MPVSVTLPALGESVTEGTVTRWLKAEGERVEADEPLLEVSTDKVDTEIPSPVSGILASIKVAEDETVEVGAELAIIDDGSGAAAPAAAPAAEPAAAPAPVAEAPAAPAPAETPAAPAPAAAPAASGTDVVLPALGESVTEGTVTRWLKEVGESVEADEPLLEVSTDKVDTEIPAPVSGTLLEILVAEDETAEVGARLAVIGVAGAAPAAAPAAAAPGGNAAILGIDYATWQRDVAAVIDAARPAIEARIAASPAGEKPALVLDIDNTSLETDFHWFWTFPTPAISKVRALTQYAHARGVAVFFVTARPGIIQSLTEHNLKAVGYPVSGLYVRDLPDLFDEVSAYKTGKRAEIEARGYTIIANIGNSATDLVGGHAERTVKLPDYGGKLS